MLLSRRTRLIVGLLGCLWLCGLFSCGSSGDSSPCGGINTEAQFLVPSENGVLQPFDSDALSTTVDNGWRHYRWDFSIDRICTATHVFPNFTVQTRNEGDAGNVKVDVTAYWFIFFQRTATLERQQTGPGTYSYSTILHDIGLKQAYGNGPGEITLQVDISFPTRGSDAADLAVGRDLVTRILMRMQYDTFVTAPS